MKNSLLFLILPFLSFSQSNYLALSSNNEFNSYGTIIEVNDDIPQVGYTFRDNGAPPHDNLIEVNGKIYGLTELRGALGKGSLYEFDYANETFDVLSHFEILGDASTTYITNLCSGNNKIYGIQTHFFSGSSLVEYDVTSQTIIPLVGLSANGISNVEQIIYGDNNKIYGVSDPTGTNVLFSYDISTSTLTSEFTFNATDGHWCHSLMKHSNGNIYGATTYGGANNEGVIFEFDPVNSTYNKLYDLTTTNKADNLVQGDANILYGYINPLSGGGGRIYQFDLNTNTFTNLHYFPSNVTPEGDAAWFRGFKSLIYHNNALYGVSDVSNSSDGVVFEYDISNNSFESHIINEASTPIFKTVNNRFVYGTRKETSNGALMEYDPLSNSVSQINGTDFGTDGLTPSKIIKASSGIIYGTTAENVLETYGDKFFRYDPIANEYEVLINFADEPSYGNDPVDMIETANGLMYIYTRFGLSATQQGKLIEYNPMTNTHTLAHEFGTLYDGSAVGEYVNLYEKNNIIYGIKRWAGNGELYKGTIFSYDTINHTYAVLYESDDLADNTSSLLTSQDIIYGVTFSGGVNDQGYVHSFNLQTNQFNVVETLTEFGGSDMVELDNGDVYGVLQNSNGVDGSIFKIDGNTGVFSTYYEFDFATKGTGMKPYKMYVVDNKLYVLTEAPTTSANIYRRMIVEFNLQSSTQTIIFDEQRYGGLPLQEDMYVMNDNRLLGRTFLRLFSFTQGGSSVETIFDFDVNTETVFSIIDLNNPSLSIEEQNRGSLMSVYPNPTSQYINIRSESAIVNVDVFTLQGQKISSHLNENRIDVKHLTNGLYFLKLTDSHNRIQTVKFVKK